MFKNEQAVKDYSIATDTGSEEQMKIAVYCGSTAGNREAFTIGAVALGVWIAEGGHTLVYGGAQGGLMGTIADAYVALPGGPGTLDEISDVIALARLGIDGKPCVLYDLDGFYQPLKKVFEKMIDSGFAYQEDFRNVLISSDIEEIEASIEKRRMEKK